MYYGLVFCGLILCTSPNDCVPTPAWLANSDPVPAPAFEVVLIAEPEVKHTAKPTVKPMRIAHSLGMYVCCDQMMCGGQHLRNYHGLTYRQAEVAIRNFDREHRRLHAEQPKPKPRPKPKVVVRQTIQQQPQAWSGGRRCGLLCRLRGGCR